MENYNELHEKLTRLQWLLQKQHMKHHHSKPMADTSKGQGRILAFLKLKDGISTKDLSYLLGIRVSSLNESLARLEKNGYISRDHSEEDKRVMLIYLTEKGREEEEPKPESGSIFDCLSQEEQIAFGQYLDRIINNLETELGSADEDELYDWMDKARERMSEEQFEELMSMRHMHGGFRRGRFGEGGHGPHGGCPHRDRGREESGDSGRHCHGPHKEKERYKEEHYHDGRREHGKHDHKHGGKHEHRKYDHKHD